MTNKSILHNRAMEQLLQQDMGSERDAKLCRGIEEEITHYLQELRDSGTYILPRYVYERYDPEGKILSTEDRVSWEWDYNEFYIEPKLVGKKLGVALRYTFELLCEKLLEKFPNRRFRIVLSVSKDDPDPGIIIHCFQYQEGNSVIDLNLELYTGEAILYAVIDRDI